MIFEEILPQIKAGQKVIRDSWTGSELYIYEVQQPLENGEAVDPYFLIKTKETPSLSMFQPTVCDILASDWKVVE